MRISHCVICSNGSQNLRKSSKHCDCFQRTGQFSEDGLARCPSCYHYTVAVDDKSDYHSAEEGTTDSEQENQYREESSQFQNQFPFQQSNTSASSFSQKKSHSTSSRPPRVVNSVNRRQQEKLDEVRKQMEELQMKEQDLMAAMNRRQKREQAEDTNPFREEYKYKDTYMKPPPAAESKKEQRAPSSSSSSGLQLRLECIEGPHRGESIHLTGTLVIGNKPVKKAGTTKVPVHRCALKMDKMASPDHVKLVLTKTGSKKKPILTVKVTDMNSANGTKINNKLLPQGSSRQAFVRDKIQVGQTVFQIVKA